MEKVCHPFGVRFVWLLLAGVPLRSTACLWSRHPFGVLMVANTLIFNSLTPHPRPLPASGGGEAMVTNLEVREMPVPTIPRPS